jgi:tetratricopeptide (TPR) repeat protein
VTAAPSSAHVHLMLGRIHDRRCQDEQAMRALSRAAELDRSLSGRALTHLLAVAQDSGHVLVAEQASARLLAFQQEEEKLGPRAASRRAGASETRGAHLARGSALLAVGRFAEAKDAFSRALALLAESRGSPVEEATAIRGLMRIATEDKQAVPQALKERLATIEASYQERLRTKPEDVQILARTYQFVDPVAAADWIEPLGAPNNCEDALQRALIYRRAGRQERVRAMLASCAPTQQWERQCIAQHYPGMTNP